MSYKQIEVMRETRLWIRDILVPVAAIIFAVPESRESIINAIKGAKTASNKKWHK